VCIENVSHGPTVDAQGNLTRLGPGRVECGGRGPKTVPHSRPFLPPFHRFPSCGRIPKDLANSGIVDPNELLPEYVLCFGRIQHWPGHPLRPQHHQCRAYCDHGKPRTPWSRRSSSSAWWADPGTFVLNQVEGALGVPAFGDSYYDLDNSAHSKHGISPQAGYCCPATRWQVWLRYNAGRRSVAS